MPKGKELTSEEALIKILKLYGMLDPAEKQYLHAKLVDDPSIEK